MHLLPKTRAQTNGWSTQHCLFSQAAGNLRDPLQCLVFCSCSVLVRVGVGKNVSQVKLASDFFSPLAFPEVGGLVNFLQASGALGFASTCSAFVSHYELKAMVWCEDAPTL